MENDPNTVTLHDRLSALVSLSLEYRHDNRINWASYEFLFTPDAIADAELALPGILIADGYAHISYHKFEPRWCNVAR